MPKSIVAVITRRRNYHMNQNLRVTVVGVEEVAGDQTAAVVAGLIAAK